MEKLVFTLEDGTTESWYVEEMTVIGGMTYLLVSDSQEDEANVYILKDISQKDDDEACYEIVDDPAELDAVYSVFQLEMDDENTTLI